ncbi:DHH family phosphoesterase [Thermosediminibacter oceani]|uniref:Phosphoesterase RecJ domain protein n=1 Tax=Thermosediminibacter oceani (strain ATCC BAA-1034 / DSM 16646 / JW/IW-1228P) TaxID=555079 RepID=D9S183_THEOJ|nr:DHH family phosphoesterase [Thermosediminibacter oceani]ADL08962.1 phosphoesterase RecJ domain protein [Thermosediminibacter oceani DSM 16646]
MRGNFFDFIKKNSLLLGLIVLQLLVMAFADIKAALGFCVLFALVLLYIYFRGPEREEPAEKTEDGKKPLRCPDENTPVLMYIQVDNYDEVLAATPEENRPELLARIDKAVTQWVQGLDGFIKKFDDDKFLAAVTMDKFRRVEEGKFAILEKIREIRTKNAMPVTLSIGASYGQKSLLEQSKIAQNALELCLGRGGDHAVVKTGSKTFFYGGKTKEVERYTRVRARVIAHALRDLMEESDLVLVLGHIFLDMDALGAGVGIVKAARCLGRESFFVLSPDQSHAVESLLNLLLEDRDIKETFISEKHALYALTRNTLVVIVDTHRPSFCYSQELLKKAERIVVIDHHRRGEEFIENALLVYLEPYASSTSEMVTEILSYIGEEVKLTPREATALLAGIAVDTRNFVFKTGVRTFDAASYLRRAGADPTLVHRLFQEQLDEFNRRAEVVKRAQILPGHIAISCYDYKPENPRLAAAQAANTLLEIKGVFAAFVLVPVDGGIAISGRSLGDINVQRILEKLGGGGHMAVAGAQIPDVTMEEAIKRLKKAIEEFMEEGDSS